MAVWTYNWANATLSGTDLGSVIDDRYTLMRNNLIEKLVDIYGFGSAETDKDLVGLIKATLHVQTVSPSAVANKIHLYGLDVGSKCELHSRDEDGNVVQLTTIGQPSGMTSKARAYLKTVNQSISASTLTTITFNEESYDVDGEFDKTTNYDFTVTKEGYHLITVGVDLTNTLANTGYIRIYDGSSVLSIRRFDLTAGDRNTIVLTDILKLSTSAAIYVQIYCGVASTIGYGENATFFAVHRIS